MDAELHTNVLELFQSRWIWTSFIAWCTAQFIKLCADYARTRRIDMSYFVSTGGMPSAHSAMVSALATSIGMSEGFNTPIFSLAASFAAITMFDAAGVRYAAGQQAKVLNKITEELLNEHTLKVTRLKELLGHTRKEVLAGMLVGIATAVAMMHVFRA